MKIAAISDLHGQRMTEDNGYRQVLLGLGNRRTVMWTAHDVNVGDFIKRPQPFYSWNWRTEYWEVLEVYSVKDE